MFQQFKRLSRHHWIDQVVGPVFPPVSFYTQSLNMCEIKSKVLVPIARVLGVCSPEHLSRLILRYLPAHSAPPQGKRPVSHCVLSWDSPPPTPCEQVSFSVPGRSSALACGNLFILLDVCKIICLSLPPPCFPLSYAFLSTGFYCPFFKFLTMLHSIL